MKWICRLAGFTLCAWFLSGCAHLQEKPVQSNPSVVLASRNNSASLLYDLLNDEKNVSKILIIKRDRDELHALIKNISATCGDASKTLARLADAEPGLNLHVMNLPPGEVAAREAESKSKEKELLHASGADFEFKLLLTQAEALNYGWHLAQVAAENSAVPEQSREFAAIREELHHLYERTLALLQENAPAR
jgi:hypothetical protein